MGAAQGMGNQLGGGGLPPYSIYVTQQPVQTLPMHQVSIFFSILFCLLFNYLFVFISVMTIVMHRLINLDFDLLSTSRVER